MTMSRLLRGFGAAALTTGLAGCGVGSWGSSPSGGALPAAGQPTVVINASPSVVRDVLVSRARARGSEPTLTAAAVVIQRALPATNEALEAACGPHVPGRAVRVVLGTEPVATGTRVLEQRYIIDGARVCPVPLSQADVAQAEASLNEVKVQVETRVARR